MKMMINWISQINLAICGALLSTVGVSSALADSYAYEAGKGQEFGVIDLTTGVFTLCGTSNTNPR